MARMKKDPPKPTKKPAGPRSKSAAARGTKADPRSTAKKRARAKPGPETRPPRFTDFEALLPGCGRPDDTSILPDLGLSDLEPGRVPPREGLFGPALRPVLEGNGEGPRFSVQRFADELRRRLQGNCRGWAFVVNQNGQVAAEDSGGVAVAGTDLDGSGNPLTQRNMTPDVRLNIASVSKTITAVAILRLLREAGLGTEARIWPFLPRDWTLGPGVDGLRFHHLLTHQSGLTSTNGNFSQTLSDAGLQTAIAAGADPGADYNYLNANFALFRVILPLLWREAGLTTANNDNPVASAFFYAVYIIEEIFGRMGGVFGGNASTSPLDSNPTRYYQAANSAIGSAYGNWAMIAGGGGWHLSARELAAFLAFITYTDDILTPTQRIGMDQLLYGWQPPVVSGFGSYLGHGGSISNNTNAPFPAVRTGIMKFNLQVEAAVVANSRITGSGDSATRLLREAYDAAWA